MSYLTLTPNAGGSPTTVKVLVASAPAARPHDVGSLRRAFDGTPHDSRRARLREWVGVQTILAASDGATLKSLLEGVQPLEANGDLTGSGVDVFCTTPELVGVTPGVVRVTWDMWEAEPAS